MVRSLCLSLSLFYFIIFFSFDSKNCDEVADIRNIYKHDFVLSQDLSRNIHKIQSKPIVLPKIPIRELLAKNKKKQSFGR